MSYFNDNNKSNQFDNYDNPNLSDDNVYVEINTTLPRKEYNVKGKFVGYSWVYGDTLQLNFSVNKKIYVNDDSLIYTSTGDAPGRNTVGTVYQKAYNTVDLKSWTCIGNELVDDNIVYLWEQDKVLTYIGNGNKVIYLTPDMSDKSVKIEITNFRKEVVHTAIFEHTNDVILDIDTELSNKLLSSVYYCNAYLVTDESQYAFEQCLIHIYTDGTYTYLGDEKERQLFDSCSDESVVSLYKYLVDNYFNKSQIEEIIRTLNPQYYIAGKGILIENDLISVSDEVLTTDDVMILDCGNSQSGW